MTPHEIRSSPTSGLRWLTGMAVAFVLFMGFVAGGCFLALLTRDLSGTSTLTALVIGVAGAVGLTAGVRVVRGLREAARPELLARLDGDGVHLREAGLPEELPEGLPDHVGWTTYPWGWIASVSHSTLDLTKAKRLGVDVPLEVLRFVLADDRLPDGDGLDRADLRQAARLLRLTPAQVRTVLLGEVGRTSYDDALAWLRTHRPDLPVVVGTTPPWSTPADADRWAESPRVAVVGAHGRLGRHVVDVLSRREPAPPVALARNEAHRAVLERAGAEVRMVDLAQGVAAVVDALRGCAAVVHAADRAETVVVEAAARAGVERLILVPGLPQGDDVVGRAAASGLSWTAFRPGLLTDGRPTGEVDLGAGVTPGPVPRADLAEVLVAAIRDEASAHAAWPITGVAAAE